MIIFVWTVSGACYRFLTSPESQSISVVRRAPTNTARYVGNSYYLTDTMPVIEVGKLMSIATHEEGIHITTPVSMMRIAPRRASSYAWPL